MAFVPPTVTPKEWLEAASRSSPLVGALIITWAACESTINTQLIGLKHNKNPFEGWPKLSHKFRERLNEWIKLCLTPSGVSQDIEGVRSGLTRLQMIRNNLAHNIAAMWIDTSNELRVFCVYDNKDYAKEVAAFDYATRPAEERPWPIKAITYSGDELMAAHKEMRSYLMLISSVQKPQGKPFPSPPPPAG